MTFEHIKATSLHDIHKLFYKCLNLVLSNFEMNTDTFEVLWIQEIQNLALIF